MTPITEERLTEIDAEIATCVERNPWLSGTGQIEEQLELMRSYRATHYPEASALPPAQEVSTLDAEPTLGSIVDTLQHLADGVYLTATLNPVHARTILGALLSSPPVKQEPAQEVVERVKDALGEVLDEFALETTSMTLDDLARAAIQATGEATRTGEALPPELSGKWSDRIVTHESTKFGGVKRELILERDGQPFLRTEVGGDYSPTHAAVHALVELLSAGDLKEAAEALGRKG